MYFLTKTCARLKFIDIPNVAHGAQMKKDSVLRIRCDRATAVRFKRYAASYWCYADTLKHLLELAENSERAPYARY